MDIKELLVESAQERSKLLMKHYNKKQETFQEDIEIIKKWFSTQPHLPETPDDYMIGTFLLLNKFSIENTKKKLDMYYTVRGLVPEVYQVINPKLPHMQEVARTIYHVPLPKRTDDDYRVSVIKFTNEIPDGFEPILLFAHAFNVTEIRLHEDAVIGDITIYDFEHFKMSQMMKFTPTQMKKAITILEKVFSDRVKGIHFVNFPSFVNTLATLAKSLLKPKLAQRVHLHTGIEGLETYISKEILPKDYGGDELSLKELNDLWRLKMNSYQERFDALDNLRTNEKLRPTPLINDEILGFHGNFRKLDVD